MYATISIATPHPALALPRHLLRHEQAGLELLVVWQRCHVSLERRTSVGHNEVLLMLLWWLYLPGGLDPCL
jgi:hypothetical protein